MQPPGGPGAGGGGDLVYTDDLTDSYSNIFANAVSKNADAEDFARVIRAIKYLNKENVTNEELEKYWDVDAALRYLAVHAFMVNGDSYTGSMEQNYYLAEKDGRITVLPWDYNLSFGAFGGGPGGGGPGGAPGDGGAPFEDNKTASSANDKTTEVINHAIDTPTIEVDMEDRPLVSVLLQRDEYREKYHQYLEELTEYTSGDFIDRLEMTEDAIYPYIERETEAFYTPEAHKTAFDVLKKFLTLRSRSIRGQLDGTIPSQTDKQNGARLIEADFSVDEMGSMGGGGGQPPEMPGERSPQGEGNNGQGGAMPPQGQMPGQNNGGNMPPQPPEMPDGGDRAAPPDMPGGNAPGAMPPPPNMPAMAEAQDNTGAYLMSLASVLILCAALFGVRLFKRNY